MVFIFIPGFIAKGAWGVFYNNKNQLNTLTHALRLKHGFFYCTISTIIKFGKSITMDKQLKKIREEIDKIDSKIKDLLIKRLEMAERIGVIKKTENLPLIDEGREEEIILRVSDKTGKFQKNMEMIYKKIIEETTLLQREIINDR